MHTLAPVASVLAGLIALSPAVWFAGAEAARQEAPDAKAALALVEELVLLEEFTAADRARRDAIFEQLALLPPLDAKSEAKWRKTIAKIWADGPTLEKKSGRHHLWPDDRGLYIVGGRTKSPKGLVIGMHGGGAGSGDAGSAHAILDSACSASDFVAIFPEVLEKTEHGWTDSGTEEFVLELVERARRTFEVDPDRVFFVGHSMGGYGSWTLGGHHADQVAAIAPTAGAPTPIMDASGAFIDVIEGVIPNLRNVPVRVYQSDDDPNVPPAANDVAVKMLEAAQARWGGYDFQYWRVSGRGHDLPPGGMEAMLEKIEGFERNARPDTIVWQPTLDWKRQCHWLWWSAPRANAIVEARLDTAANTVRITSNGLARDGLAGLFVLVDGELFDLTREIVIEVDGAETFRGRVEPNLAVLAQTASSGDGPLTFTARVPVIP
jgi:pimeloyl-ACP methyl ester carboxylesterase